MRIPCYFTTPVNVLTEVCGAVTCMTFGKDLFWAPIFYNRKITRTEE